MPRGLCHTTSHDTEPARGRNKISRTGNCNIATPLTQLLIQRTIPDFFKWTICPLFLSCASLPCYLLPTPACFHHSMCIAASRHARNYARNQEYHGGEAPQAAVRSQGQWMLYRVVASFYFPSQVLPKEVLGVEFWDNIHYLLSYGEANPEEKYGPNIQKGWRGRAHFYKPGQPSNIFFQMEGNRQNRYCLSKRNFTGTLNASLQNSASSQKTWKKIKEVSTKNWRNPGRGINEWQVSHPSEKSKCGKKSWLSQELWGFYTESNFYNDYFDHTTF